MQRDEFLNAMILTELEDAVGIENCSTRAIDKATHSVDYYWLSRMWADRGRMMPQADFIVAPKDAQETSKVLKIANYYKIPVTTWGGGAGSQGGALTIACAALVPELNRAFAFYPFLCDYKRVWEMDLDKNAYSEIAYWLRHFDPTHSRVDEFFERLGYIDLQNISHRIKADFKMLTCLLDTICPPSTQFAMYNKVKSNKDVVICPDFGHETPPGLEDMAMQYILSM